MWVAGGDAGERREQLTDRGGVLLAGQLEPGAADAIDTLPEPTAWDIAAALTWSRGWDALHGMALAETIAHLHYLAATGAVQSRDGVPARWRRILEESA